MDKITYDDLENGKADGLIKARASFEVVGLGGRMKSSVQLIETAIESEGLSCRIYTYGRIAAAGGTIFGGPLGALGALSAIGMAAHNLVTFNPDYEVAKHKIEHKLTVTYKKGDEEDECISADGSDTPVSEEREITCETVTDKVKPRSFIRSEE